MNLNIDQVVGIIELDGSQPFQHRRWIDVDRLEQEAVLFVVISLGKHPIGEGLHQLSGQCLLFLDRPGRC